MMMLSMGDDDGYSPWRLRTQHLHNSRVAQWSKTLHPSARGVTAVPGLAVIVSPIGQRAIGPASPG